METFLGGRRVMVILRGLSAREAVAAAHRAWEAGVRAVEVPLHGPDGAQALAATAAAAAEVGVPVGAGTVLTANDVAAARQAGAQYTVAPGFDPAVAAASRDAGLPHLPGVATPTEVHHARAAGHRWLKAFPASALTPAWFRAVRGPFPDVHLVATGGVPLAQAAEYLDAGAAMVAFGADCTSPSQLPLLAALAAD